MTGRDRAAARSSIGRTGSGAAQPEPTTDPAAPGLRRWRQPRPLHADGGDDQISVVGLLAGIIRLTLDGGTGSDTTLGSSLADRILGGDGNDVAAGSRGNHTALLGAGDDVRHRNPGDGSDTVLGGAGLNIVFDASNIAKVLEIPADGGKVRMTPDIAAVTMALNDMEAVRLQALGGTDRIAVRDLSRTDVSLLSIDLGLFGSGGAQADGIFFLRPPRRRHGERATRRRGAARPRRGCADVDRQRRGR